MEKQKILIIDHASRILSILSGFLSNEPYDVFTAENGIEGLEILKREPIHLVVADRGAEGHDGIILLKRVKAENIQTPILIMGGSCTDGINRRNNPSRGGQRGQ